MEAKVTVFNNEEFGDEDIINAVKTLSTGDTITVRGKCTDVGEVMGYSLDLDEIVQ